jgi:hypothetical protein
VESASAELLDQLPKPSAPKKKKIYDKVMTSRIPHEEVEQTTEMLVRRKLKDIP